MTSNAHPPVEPVRHGPDKPPPRNRTLGWDALAWTVRYLKQPDGDNAGAPWRFTPEQVRFLLWFYAIDDQGRFRYRSAVYRRLKGSGKDPLGAAIACIELLGPCRFGGWRDDGTPIAVPHPRPWIQIAAVTKEQTQNTMSLFDGLLTAEAIEDYGVDLGKEVIYTASGGRLAAVTSSPRALEGARITFALKNETHHWIRSNQGLEMDAVIRRNLAKSRDGSARSLSITNAHRPGEDSVGEREWELYQKIRAGKTRASGLLYDSIEAPPDIVLSDPDSLRAGLLAARGDSTWINVDVLMEEIWSMPDPADARRFYLNQIVAAEDSLIAPYEWDACLDEDAELAPGDEITLGFDGGKTDDATALVAVRVRDRLAVPLLVRERPEGPAGEGWEVDRGEFDAVVRAAFDRYRVAGFFSDTALWETYVDAWAADFGRQLTVKASPRHAVAFDMRGNLRRRVEGTERLLSAIRDQDLRHNGDPTLRRHALNARRRPTPHGLSFGKEHRESPRKVDAFAALLLADMARAELLARGREKARSRRVVVLR